jgi:hypothetical protein
VTKRASETSVRAPLGQRAPGWEFRRLPRGGEPQGVQNCSTT